MAAVDKIEGKRKPEDFIGHRNRRAGHECVKDRTTFLSKQLTVLVKMVIIDEKE